MSFEGFFRQANRRGISPVVLRKLLKREVFGNLIQSTLARIREIYEGYSSLDFQRAWCFDLHHQQRFHPGSAAWILSFGAWPVLPLIDREILEVAAGMPASTFENRRLEAELVRRRFPKLAELPLDHSSYDTTPLTPTITQHITRFAIGDGWIWRSSRNARRLRRLFYSRLLKVEPRYYYRVWDFNSQDWRALRCQAEKSLKLASLFFDEKATREVLPGADKTLEFENAAVESMGPKCLVGFMLWAENNARAFQDLRP
jgi:hypothetical protein